LALNPGSCKPFSAMVKAALGTVMKKFPRRHLEFYPHRARLTYDVIVLHSFYAASEICCRSRI